MSDPKPAVDGSTLRVPEPRRPEELSPQERLQAVVDASKLSEVELGAFLRRTGIHEVHLREWRAMALVGLQADGKSAADRRVKELEQAVIKREKALAEAAMLLLQEKKTAERTKGRGRKTDHMERQAVIAAVKALCEQGMTKTQAAEACGFDIRTLQNWAKHSDGDRRAGPTTGPANALLPDEQQSVLDMANSPRFRDLSPKVIVPLLAEEGQYLGSESTFYRLLRREGQINHRGRQRPPQARPRELEAREPDRVYSWDIAYLPSVVRGSYFYCYVFMDIWSRKIVGFSVETEESPEIAAALFARICRERKIAPGRLVLHSDRGGPMRGATMQAMLRSLGVLTSFSRPRVSDDNPYSESLFKTMKYTATHPLRPFTNLTDSHDWVAEFVGWYNCSHLHSQIGFVTPNQREAGEDIAIFERRRRTYEAAHARSPRRWISGRVRAWERPTVVYLNPSSATLRSRRAKSEGETARVDHARSVEARGQ
jgi:transposase InsO family protein